ncbi:MAG: mechanosensitive ion channel family protein [Tissierellia bacterium]|nr:mechanosensitive ion channel family protein [Tissierellia bacterium]
MSIWKEYIYREGGGLTALGKIGSIILVILLIRIFVAIINKIISKSIYTTQMSKLTEKNRIITITELVKNIITYTGFFIGFLMILDIMGISPQTILATAGIGSLAVGIGAQSLIRDLINGFFIIFEDQYSVGDLVKIEDWEGRVEELGIRVTKLRGFDGKLIIIPNGNIKVVTNYQRGSMRARIDYPVHRDIDPDMVLTLLEKIVAPFREEAKVLQGPDIWGITENTENSYIVTIVAYAAQGDQYGLERELRKKITQEFKQKGITGPNKMVEMVTP